MKRHKYLVIGAGISGLAIADRLANEDVCVLESEEEIGGYCRTIKKSGFVWDYSGHFFHFKNPDIERELIQRMPYQEVASVSRVSKIYWGDTLIDFPFQKNIHQLPREDFIDCLHGLHFRSKKTPTNFLEMLEVKFGQGITERFLAPYNKKLYAVDLSSLDVDAMGRFFPYADESEIIANFRSRDNSNYNSNFIYPRGGAYEYVKAMSSRLTADQILASEPVIKIDVKEKIVTTLSQKFCYDVLVNTSPFPNLLRMCGVTSQVQFSSNRVLVFNFGFDSKGPDGIHWIYYPQSEIVFYRIGFYDNIFESRQMSIYVEIGLPTGARLTDSEIRVYREKALSDLRQVGVLKGQQLVAEHFLVMDPAYVHMTQDSLIETARLKKLLAAKNIFSIGRYGGWTYCSIEDNIIEARALADILQW